MSAYTDRCSCVHRPMLVRTPTGVRQHEGLSRITWLMMREVNKGSVRGFPEENRNEDRACLFYRRRGVNVGRITTFFIQLYPISLKMVIFDFGRLHLL